MKRALAVLSMVLLGGCFEVEQSINLTRIFPARADFHLGVDLEPMIVVMAQFGREMEGKKGPMTAEELAKAKAEFKKSEKKESKDEPSRADVEKSLPEGVKLISYDVKEREFGVDTNFKFGFKKLSQLVGVHLPSRGEGDPTKKNVIDTPVRRAGAFREGRHADHPHQGPESDAVGQGAGRRCAQARHRDREDGQGRVCEDARRLSHHPRRSPSFPPTPRVAKGTR